MEQKRLCYISRNYYNLTSAGNKAKTDNEDTLVEMGAINLGLPRTIRNSKILAFFLDLIGIIRACILLQKDDVLFLQYPVKKYFSFLCHVAHLKGAKTVSLIHDLGSFRRKKLTIQKEINRLSNSDYIIASNEKMKGWLEEYGLQKPVGALGLFDYRSESKCPEEVTEREQVKVVYAGALSMKKNSFLIELSKTLSHWQLLVCGNKEGLQGLQNNPLITYQGFVPSEEFIKHIDADFGLVWDGDSLDGCSGEYGQYLKWNSPHKVSFYLRAGLPLIIWKEAAVAPIIEEAGAGITIRSLKELDGKLANLTPEQKKEMKKQAVNLAQKLNKGRFLQDSFRSL
nr:galactofuranosyltransferase [uncultured Prevotella sp.]